MRIKHFSMGSSHKSSHLPAMATDACGGTFEESFFGAYHFQCSLGRDMEGDQVPWTRCRDACISFCLVKDAAGDWEVVGRV